MVEEFIKIVSVPLILRETFLLSWLSLLRGVKKMSFLRGCFFVTFMLFAVK